MEIKVGSLQLTARTAEQIEIIEASTGAVMNSVSAIIGPEMTEGSFLWSPDGGYIAYKGNPAFRAIGTWTGQQVWPEISVVSREFSNLLRLDAGSRNTEVWLIAWY